MKYFLHDSNAFQDEKITELFNEFGYEGLGLFYTILEKLAYHEKPVKTSVLKSQLKVGKKLEKCWKFMESLQIISSNNGETFNKQLLNFSEKYQIKKEKNKEKISEWRKNQEITENVTSYKKVRNTPKVKESKGKEIKDILLIDVETYFSENGYTLDSAKKFFNYYSVSNWKDSKGNQVKNWKQKAQSVWFKPENKIQEHQKPKLAI
ncbi:MAG TPA: Lin1244/Lin1753 domain-containing protein [Flavobacterium sp.]|nr:Lin1244/Lin1753 domain-containing protein [Flavobacterium sp.]